MATDVIAPRRIDARSYAVDEVLRDGSAIHIRAIRPDDRARLLDHFNGLSARTRYFRFFGHKLRLTNEDLTRFTELDFTRHVGLAGTLWQDGSEHFVGVGRYVRNAGLSRAEIALAVLDEYQGTGIGPLLIRHLGGLLTRTGSPSSKPTFAAITAECSRFCARADAFFITRTAAPDSDTATKVALLVRSSDRATTELWTATPLDRFVDLARQLKSQPR